jgi:hypothetical protein
MLTSSSLQPPGVGTFRSVALALACVLAAALALGPQPGLAQNTTPRTVEDLLLGMAINALDPAVGDAVASAPAGAERQHLERAAQALYGPSGVLTLLRAGTADRLVAAEHRAMMSPARPEQNAAQVHAVGTALALSLASAQLVVFDDALHRRAGGTPPTPGLNWHIDPDPEGARAREVAAWRQAYRGRGWGWVGGLFGLGADVRHDVDLAAVALAGASVQAHCHRLEAAQPMLFGFFGVVACSPVAERIVDGAFYAQLGRRVDSARSLSSAMDVAAAVAVPLAVLGVIVWRVRKSRRELKERMAVAAEGED